MEEFYLAGGLDGENAKYAGSVYFDQQRAKTFEHSTSFDPKKIKDLEQVYKLAEKIIEGYYQWLEVYGHDFQYENFRAEDKLSMTGPHGSILNGRLDLLADHKDTGDITVLDFKVVQSIEGMVKDLGVSEQGLMYALLAKINHPGRQVRVVWSMMKRSMRTGAAKPPFYQRHELNVNNDMIRQYYEQLHGQVGEVLRLEAMLNEGHKPHVVAYPTPSGDCSWKCSFYAVCGLMNDPQNDTDYIFDNHFTKYEPKKPGQDFHGQILEEAVTPVTLG
jgi:hypothetical protein